MGICFPKYPKDGLKYFIILRVLSIENNNNFTGNPGSLNIKDHNIKQTDPL